MFVVSSGLSERVSCDVIAWQEEAEVLGWVVVCLFCRDFGCFLLVEVYQRGFLVM